MVETFAIVEDLWGSTTYQGTSTGCVLVPKVNITSCKKGYKGWEGG